MATSGYKEVQVTKYDTLRFNWGVDSQNIGANTSFVKWTMYLISGSNGRISSTASKAWSVTVDGTTYTGTNTVGIGNNESKLLASGATTIWHNADGTKTFSYSFSQDFGISWGGYAGAGSSSVTIGTKSGSGAGTLDTIPRAATITSAPNFTDLDNPTITYSNPAGNAVYGLQACISWTGADDIAYRNIPTNGTSYTFNLTEVERTKLRAAVTSGTSRNVTFYVTTWFTAGGNPTYSTLNRTFTINDANPSITELLAKDTNEKTLSLTGNENTWIKGQSNIAYAIIAQAKQGATIASYQVSIGNKTSNTSFGTISGATGDTITATVTDSRGNSATANVKAARFIDYTPITCGFKNVKFNVDNEKGKLDFTITGNYFNGSFGASNNGISVYYRYKAEYEEYTDWILATPEVTDNGYEYTESIAGLDYRKNYYIEAKAADSLVSVISLEYRVAKIIPVFDWSETDFNFNVPIKINGVTMPYVVEQVVGDAGYWTYRKWSNGLCEMWIIAETTYQEAHYMSTYVAYPVGLNTVISAIGNLNSFTGNLSTYLTTNVKLEPTTYGCNVWVQNSNNSFTDGQTANVSIHIVGRWK